MTSFRYCRWVIRTVIISVGKDQRIWTLLERRTRSTPAVPDPTSPLKRQPHSRPRPLPFGTSMTHTPLVSSLPPDGITFSHLVDHTNASFIPDPDRKSKCKIVTDEWCPAVQIFAFADKYRGKYSDGLGGVVCPFYCSYSGYNDELVWGAAWMFRATREESYRQYLIQNGNALGGTSLTAQALSWDNKYAGAQVLLTQSILLHRVKGLQGYKDRADNYICGILPRSISPTNQLQYSPGGMLFYMGQLNLQYVTTATFMLTNYARYLTAAKQTLNCGGRQVTPKEIFSVAQRQTDYILGANPRGLSYMIGFGRNYPKHSHHRAASLPSIKVQPGKIGCGQGFEYFNSQNPDANVAMGAIVGGPDQSDNINDNRANFAQTEPATYVNAAIVGPLTEFALGRQYY